MTEMQLLAEANELVRNGLRQAAIDLLIEYLDVNPDSSAILHAVGKTYLLDHQPEKAVIYLKRSLETQSAVSGPAAFQNDYSAEKFDKNDLDFIDGEDDGIDDQFLIDADFKNKVVGGRKESANERNREIIKLSTSNKDDHRPDREDRGYKVRYKTRKKTGESKSKEPRETPEDNPDLSRVNTDDNEQHETPSDILTEDDLDTAEELDTSLYQNEDDQVIQFGLFEPHHLDDFNIGTTPDLFGELEESEDTENDFESGLDLLYQDEDEFPDEFVWDDFEDAEEFDDTAYRESTEVIEIGGKISREQRASQVAIDVLQATDWDPENHSLLQQIFVENGWSAAKTAIVRLIDKGITPEELKLARNIKRFWAGNSKYWMTFHRIRVDAFGKQTHDGYKQMSWLEALRIIKCFESLPDAEEVYLLIDELFDEWYWSSRRRRSFKAFFKYLKYRTGSMNRTLSGSYFYSFYELPSDIIDDELTSPDYGFSEQHCKLADLGVLHDHWPPPPKNIVLITGEE